MMTVDRKVDEKKTGVFIASYKYVIFRLEMSVSNMENIREDNLEIYI